MTISGGWPKRVNESGFIVKVGGWEKEEFLYKKEVSLLGQVLYNNESSPNDALATVDGATETL